MRNKTHLISAAAARDAAALFAATAMFAMGPAAARADGTPLGHSPLCEASAALIVDCPGASGSCLLVGDNEEEASLFWFRLDGTPLEKAKQQQSKFKGGKIGDIEALTAAGEGRIAVFGSHSRSTTCRESKERWRFGVIDGVKDKGVKLALTESNEFNASTLFGRNLPKGSLIEAASLAIKTAEAGARKAENDAEQCNQAPAYNAEGAVNVASAGAPDIWIGLRSPLLPRPTQAKGGRHGLAVLMHLKGLDAYSFDKVAALDLGGRGIRELAYADGWVLVIAGPPQDLKEEDDLKKWPDGKGPFRLMRFRAKELEAERVIVPGEEQAADLPISSEGLAVFGDEIIVLIDGNQASKKQPTKCATPAAFVVRKIADFVSKSSRE
ncbi:MAG TPA: DUF3616 domain-containing protein [Candidatus Accumulibacter phosphatis]|nr:MAG: hypothetical protein AW07_01582 [Candidatus Accumulibacter sp. SK-11]HAY29637.1 DUF3616 domain-containing protein [Accumulibacter sp.]HRL75419.1 DUF3616 domain-containing protein [Candidatus Accumulibacter phosphatis]HCN67929.1 DUF3616 domain-containing protein [Accumulibacter sp.]HCV12584.1 DUF3616 domain-containing protein [Accumulibacter sp.]